MDEHKPAPNGAEITIVAQTLAAAGIEFIYQEPVPGGVRRLSVPALELDDFVTDRDAWCARQSGVNRDDYVSWRAESYCVYCSAQRRDGKPCQKVVPGGANVDPRRWVELQGSVCVAHEERGGNR